MKSEKSIPDPSSKLSSISYVKIRIIKPPIFPWSVGIADAKKISAITMLDLYPCNFQTFDHGWDVNHDNPYPVYLTK